MPYPTTPSRCRPLVLGLALLLCMACTLSATARALGHDDLSFYLELGVDWQADWPGGGRQRQTLQDFYRSRLFSPLWLDSEGPLPAAETLRDTLEHAYREGLESSRYPLQEIERRWHAKDPAALAELEWLLSLAALAYGSDVQTGCFLPGEINPLWHIPPPAFDGRALLDELAHSSDIASVLTALPPPHPEYRQLRSALAYYREMARLDGWSALPEGPSLKPGESHPQVPLLRQRLFVEGDLLLDVENPEPLYDEELRVAVERFQQRHGLKVDAIVGPATRAAMNIDIKQRIEQIKLNMERWRWLPREWDSRYILVNIPAFHLTAYEAGDPVLAMDVIVGQRERPTPILSGQIHSVVLNPDWTPTRNIIIKDLVPAQQRNPEYMPSRRIRVYHQGEELDPRNVDWRKVNLNYLPYTLRQDPGPLNAMGQYKFLFSNDFQIFLHDTPQRGLFNLPERTFSSGCIRVSRPQALADYILANGNARAEPATLQEAIKSGMPKTLAPGMPPQVYLVYFTTWVGSDNRLHFRDDIYQLDDITRIQETIRLCREPNLTTVD